MEQALTAVCKDIRLGKILIQTNLDTGEPEVRPAAAWHTALPLWHVTKHPSFPPQLHYLRLPKEISEDYVILMDSTVSTGAAAMMAVRVLLVRARLGGWGHGILCAQLGSHVSVCHRTMMCRRTGSSCCRC